MFAKLLEALTAPSNLRMYVFIGCLLVGFLPVFVLSKWLHFQRKRDAAAAKSPLTEGLLRYPGQSAMERAEKLRDEMGDRLLTVSLFPIMSATPVRLSGR